MTGDPFSVELLTCRRLSFGRDSTKEEGSPLLIPFDLNHSMMDYSRLAVLFSLSDKEFSEQIFKNFECSVLLALDIFS